MIEKNTDLEVLLDGLIEKMGEDKNFFTPSLIVLPSLKMKDYIISHWLKKKNSVLMNVDFIEINEVLFSFLDHNDTLRLMKKDEFKILILKYYSNAKKDDIPSEMMDYLYDKEKLDAIRLSDLCTHLADIFSGYENDCFQIPSDQKKIYDFVLKEAEKNYLTTLAYSFSKRRGIKKMGRKVYFFGFSYFEPIQEAIIEEIKKENDCSFFLLKVNKERRPPFLITACPSKQKEIENVHSHICELLKDKENRLSDFVVLAKNISDYEPLIKRTFHQDNVDYPDIPYSIIGSQNQSSDVTSALKKLIEISHKGYFTRIDFQSFITNAAIMKARNLTKEDSDSFVKCILRANVYRNSDRIDDWDYIKKRLLLSKIVDINDHNQNIVNLSNVDYLPYSSIDMNDERIVKFISLIDDLNSWLCFVKGEYINGEDYEGLRKELDYFFSNPEREDFQEPIEYRKVLSLLSLMEKMNYKKNTIKKNIVLNFLLDASFTTTRLNGSCYTSGVTFADISRNTLLPAKYVFMLGMGFQSFPTLVVRNELDKREKDTVTAKQERENFLLEYENSSQFFVSYLSLDLSSDAELYPSSFLSELTDKKIKDVQTTLDLDEKRDYSQLYTKREYSNKAHFLDLTKEKTKKEVDSIPVSRCLPNKVKLKDMARFLEEPLSYKANVLFGRQDDDDEKMRDEFEPFSLSILDQSKIVSQLLQYLLDDKITEEKEFRHELEMNHVLPCIDKRIKDSAFRNVKQSALMIQAMIGQQFESVKLDDLVLPFENSSFVITHDYEIIRSCSGISRTYFSTKLAKDDKVKQFLLPYVISLMDVASLDAEMNYTISLMVATAKSGGTKSVSYLLSPSRAREILIQIYKEMTSFEDVVFLSSNMIDTKDENYPKYKYEYYDDHGIWAYYEDKYLFDFNSSLFLSSDDFEARYFGYKKKVESMVLFLKSKQADEQANQEEKETKKSEKTKKKTKKEGK